MREPSKQPGDTNLQANFFIIKLKSMYYVVKFNFFYTGYSWTMIEAEAEVYELSRAKVLAKKLKAQIKYKI